MTMNADTSQSRETEIRKLVREAFDNCQITDIVATWSTKPLSTEKSCGVYIRVSRRDFDQPHADWGFSCRRIASFLANQEVSFIIETVNPYAAEQASIDAAQPDLGVLTSTIDRLRAGGSNPAVAVVPIALMFPVLSQLRPPGDEIKTPSGAGVRLIWDHDAAPERILLYDPAAVAWHATSRSSDRVAVDCSIGGIRVKMSVSTHLAVEVWDTSSVWSIAITGQPMTIEEYRRMAEEGVTSHA